MSIKKLLQNRNNQLIPGDQIDSSKQIPAQSTKTHQNISQGHFFTIFCTDFENATAKPLSGYCFAEFEQVRGFVRNR